MQDLLQTIVNGLLMGEFTACVRPDNYFGTIKIVNLPMVIHNVECISYPTWSFLVVDPFKGMNHLPAMFIFGAACYLLVVAILLGKKNDAR